MARPPQLFRSEALDARRPRLTGAIVIAQPPGHGVLAAAATLFAIAVTALMYFGRYTDHTTVTGLLVPARGVVEVRGTRLGRIETRTVDEGDRVVAGQRLFAISAERETALGTTDATVRRTLDRQLHSLEAQIAELHALERTELGTLENALAELDSETLMIEASIAAQRERSALVGATLERYAQMQSRGFVAPARLATERERLLDQQARLTTLERELAAAHRHRTEVAGQLRSLPIRYQHQRAELERAAAAAEREIAESEARRELVVTAPVSGTATAVLADVGRMVDASSLLVSILPEGTELRAHLYAPSRAIGFVAAGDRVKLRYRAYPYERFGHGGGRVESVSRTALGANELTGERLSSALRPGSYYRIIVRPDLQTAPTPAAEPLQAGMLLEAELVGQTRRLYEWALDPYLRLVR